jgi:hypothetical protein
MATTVKSCTLMYHTYTLFSMLPYGSFYGVLEKFISVRVTSKLVILSLKDF